MLVSFAAATAGGPTVAVIVELTTRSSESST